MFSAFLRSPASGYLFIATAIAVVGLVAYIYNEGKSACVSEQNVQIVEEEQTYEKKQIEIRRLTDDDLVRRYCTSSVFDVPVEVCVQTHSNAK